MVHEGAELTRALKQESTSTLSVAPQSQAGAWCLADSGQASWGGRVGGGCTGRWP